MRAHRIIQLVVFASFAGCSSSNSTTPNTNAVTVTAGDAQSGLGGVALPTNLQVVVTDASGSPSAGQTITWAGTGSAQPFPTTSVTDAAGTATTTLILGATIGAQGARATLAGGKSVTFTATATAEAPAVTISVLDGSGELSAGGTALPNPLRAIVRDQVGAAAGGRLVQWQVTSGSGHLASGASLTGADGIAAIAFTPGTDLTQTVTASTGSAPLVIFTVHGYAAPLHLAVYNSPNLQASPDTTCVALAKLLTASVTDSLGRGIGGVRVTFSGIPTGDRIALDSMITVEGGAAVDTLHLDAVPGTHTVQVAVPGTTLTGTTTFVALSPCPAVFHAEVLTGGDTVAPGSVVPIAATVTSDSGPQPQHLVTWTVVSGGGSISPTTTPADGLTETTFRAGPATGIQVVRASTPGLPDFDLTFTVMPGSPVLVADIPVSGTTFYHDTFVRDGIAFGFAWDRGVLIYDVGNGMLGGSPSNPKLISQIITGDDGLAGPSVHNGWWFQNPVTGEKKYLFVGQEGPATVGSSSSGDIHIVDVSDLTHPVEVGFIHIPGAGTHNFWMDEANQVLYAAYYNAGVVKIDVSGTLSGDMSSRIVAQTLPGGPGHTFTWGVMLSGGTLYASDMVSGFWALDPVSLAIKGGGNDFPSSFALGSDLWVAGNVAYSGNWGNGGLGAKIAIWSLDANGVPTLANTLTVINAGTMSDVAVTPDGRMLVGTTEGGPGNGLYVWDRTDPIHPTLAAYYLVTEGLHTAETKVVNGRTYVFAARDPNKQALMIFDITDVVH